MMTISRRCHRKGVPQRLSSTKTKRQVLQSCGQIEDNRTIIEQLLFARNRGGCGAEIPTHTMTRVAVDNNVQPCPPRWQCTSQCLFQSSNPHGRLGMLIRCALLRNLQSLVQKTHICHSLILLFALWFMSLSFHSPERLALRGRTVLTALWSTSGAGGYNDSLARVSSSESLLVCAPYSDGSSILTHESTNREP